MNKLIRVVAAGVVGHIVGDLMGDVVAIGTEMAAVQITEDANKCDKAATVAGFVGYWVTGTLAAIDIYKSLE